MLFYTYMYIYIYNLVKWNTKNEQEDREAYFVIIHL